MTGQAGRRAQRIHDHEWSQEVWELVLNWLKFYWNNMHMVIYFILKPFYNIQRGFLLWIAWWQLAGWSSPRGRSESVIFNSSLWEETHTFGTSCGWLSAVQLRNGLGSAMHHFPAILIPLTDVDTYRHLKPRLFNLPKLYPLNLSRSDF